MRGLPGEAVLCVQDDGEDIAAVVGRAGGMILAKHALAYELEHEVRTALLSAVPGQVLGPYPREDGRATLLILEGKSEPTLADPKVRAHVQETLEVRAFRAELADRVRWLRWRPAGA